MDASLVIEHILVSLCAAALYHGTAFGGKVLSGKAEYSVQKGIRTGVAGLIQAGCCIGFGWLPADGMNFHDLLLVGVGAAFGIDNGLKAVGWRVR